jgi:hypothetical protein
LCVKAKVIISNGRRNLGRGKAGIDLLTFFINMGVENPGGEQKMENLTDNSCRK